MGDANERFRRFVDDQIFSDTAFTMVDAIMVKAVSCCFLTIFGASHGLERKAGPTRRRP
ncbi:MAG: hypothetical protein AB7E05_16335 [Sphingobium sp.]